MIDRGMSIADVEGLLEVAGDSVDVVKLGWGTALVAAIVAVVSAFYLPGPLLALIRAATLVVSRRA